MTKKIILAAIAMPFLAAALPVQAETDYRAKAVEIYKKDFQARGQAALDRLDADGLQTICNRTDNNPPQYMSKQLESDQMAKVKYPADGKLMGDWKKGERLAQSGRGFTWSDKATDPVGGNCYNCHQISPQETSFGTVGPSLYNYGKLRGAGPEMQKYTYVKIFNAKAYNACSDMPRFGHVDALKPEQIKDLVALLLDPESPVNK